MLELNDFVVKSLEYKSAKMIMEILNMCFFFLLDTIGLQLLLMECLLAEVSFQSQSIFPHSISFTRQGHTTTVELKLI